MTRNWLTLSTLQSACVYVTSPKTALKLNENCDRESKVCGTSKSMCQSLAEGKMYISSLSVKQKIMAEPIFTKFTGKNDGMLVYHILYLKKKLHYRFLKKRGCVFFPRISALRFFSPADANCTFAPEYSPNHYQVTT